MQVRAAALAQVAAVSDQIAFFDLVSLFNHQAAVVGIQGAVTAGMFQHYIISQITALLGFDYHSISCGPNRGALFQGDVYPEMKYFRIKLNQRNQRRNSPVFQTGNEFLVLHLLNLVQPGTTSISQASLDSN